MSAPKRPPAFQFYVDAWLSSVSVATMPPEVEGTYIRLLAYQWLSVVLPSDPSQLRRLTKLDERQWRKAWPLLERHFPEVEGGRQNPTLHGVHLERLEYLEKQKANGQHGGRPRGSQNKPTINPLDNPEETRGLSKQNPPPNPDKTSVSGSVTVTGSVSEPQQQLTAANLTERDRRMVLLTAAANRGIDERYGEQPSPLRWSAPAAANVVDVLDAAGIDTDFAAAVIFSYAKSLTLERPPRSLSYFTQHVVDRWHAEFARREALAFKPTGPVDAPEAREVDQMRFFAVRYAQEGAAEWQAYCDDRGITWRAAS